MKGKVCVVRLRTGTFHIILTTSYFNLMPGISIPTDKQQSFIYSMLLLMNYSPSSILPASAYISIANLNCKKSSTNMYSVRTLPFSFLLIYLYAHFLQIEIENTFRLPLLFSSDTYCN